VSDWGSDATGYLAEIARQPAARAPATIGEIWESEWKRGGLDTISGIGQPRLAAQAELSSAIEGATGQSIADYASARGERLSGVDDDYDAAVMGRLVDTLPEDKRKAIEPLKDVRLNAAKKAQKIEADAGDVAAATYGLSGHATAFIAGIARQSVDPVNIAAMVATAPLGGEGGVGMAALARFAGREALSNAAAQALVEPVIEPARKELGLEGGFGRAAGNIVEAGIGGGILGGLFHAAGRGLRNLRGGRPAEPAQRAAPDGTITPPAPETRTGDSSIAPAARSDPAPAGPLAPVHPAEQFAPDDFHAVGDLAMRDHVVDAMSPVDTPAGRFQHAAKVDEAAQRMNAVTGFQAFHGSPHDFDRFDVTKIGTGEGAQAYGHGLYFAEAEGVARSYQEGLSTSKVGGKSYNPENPVHAAAGLADEMGRKAALAEARRRAKDPDPTGFYDQVAAILKSDRQLPEIEASGALYKVQISANRDHFLDWDKPIGEQAPFVRDALLNHPNPMIAGTAEKYGHDVSNFYNRIAVRLGIDAGQQFEDAIKGGGFVERQAMASRALAEAGIPGIKYLDGVSRDGGTGTRNYVVFDDRHVAITHKNNEPVRLSDLPFPDAEKVKVKPDAEPPAKAETPAAGAPRQLGDPALAADAARVLEDAGGDSRNHPAQTQTAPRAR
jgi:hypothetical protein